MMRQSFWRWTIALSLSRLCFFAIIFTIIGFIFFEALVNKKERIVVLPAGVIPIVGDIIFSKEESKNIKVRKGTFSSFMQKYSGGLYYVHLWTEAKLFAYLLYAYYPVACYKP